MLAKTLTAAVVGMKTRLIEVEVDVQSRGLPGWSMVGLLETAVREARDRVLPAIRNSGYELPNRKTTINLAPAHIKKRGAHFDLAIAIGMLLAWEVCKPKTQKRYLLAGELSLTGKLLPVTGVLLMSLAAQEEKLDGLIVPTENEEEAELVEGVETIAARTLTEVITFLNDDRKPNIARRQKTNGPKREALDFNEVHDQQSAKRALEIAAAGGHHLLMVGPPGSGKTMLAERFSTILPPLTPAEKLETMKITSLHGLLDLANVASWERPFRAPHHTISYAGLIGGGSHALRSGEISLAHNGVLFLDELGEFARNVLEALRQPLESGQVKVARIHGSLSYPARFLLIAAMNPCRCGYLNHPDRLCTCTLNHIMSYRKKLSGPLMDRIDLHVEIGPVSHQKLLQHHTTESSAEIRKRVIAARALQAARLGPEIRVNANIPPKLLKTTCALQPEAMRMLESAAERLRLSGRSLHRLLKLSRTIADLAQCETIESEHLLEALHYRPRDEEFF